MKRLVMLFLIIPFISFSQIEKAIKIKVAIMQNFVSKGEEGQTMFWQTKGKITFAIVNYTEEQNFQFKELFINQYNELEEIYKRMIISEDERDTDLYIKTLIRQEDDYRKLLKSEQLKKYSDKLTEIEKSNPKAYESYISLFFSDNLLAEFKTKFSYK